MIVFSKPSFLTRAAAKWCKPFIIAYACLSHLLPRSIRPVFCLGDSHINVWNYVDKYVKGCIPRFVTFTVSGATALGMANPNSKTNALKEYSKVLRLLPRESFVLFNLGEVDCGYLIWSIAQRDNIAHENIFCKSLESYQRFLMDVSATGLNVIIVSAPLPTISDNEYFGEVASARSSVSASQLDRTALTLAWNSELKKFCEQNNFTYICTDNVLLDSSKGLISDAFKNKIKGDHHLDSHAYAAAIVIALASSRHSLSMSENDEQ